MTLEESWQFEGFLENIVQFRWLGTPTNFSPSLLDGLGIEHIKFHSGS